MKKNFIVLLLSLGVFNIALSQNTILENDTLTSLLRNSKAGVEDRGTDVNDYISRYTPLSPEVGSMIRNDQTKIDLFNGIPDITIPIHEIKVKDFSLPIYLKYNIRGNMPDLHPSSVGLGWTLYTGGQITRKINGFRDDRFVFSQDIKWGGEIESTKNTRTFDDYIERSSSADPSPYKFCRWMYNYDGLHVQKDYLRAPDLDEFIVNVGKLNASFYIYRDKSGKIVTKIVSQNGPSFNIDIEEAVLDDIPIISSQLTYTGMGYAKELKGNISLKGYPGATTPLSQIKKIKLTTSDGTIYVFGNSMDALSISFNYNPSHVYFFNGRYRKCDGEAYNNDLMNPSQYESFFWGEITSWHLTQIITPQKQTISFDYIRDNIHIIEEIADKRTPIINGWDKNDDPELCHFPEWTTNYIYPSRIKNISASNGEDIDFAFSKRNDLLNYRSIDLTAPKNTQRMKKMIPYRDNISMISHKLLEKNYFHKLDQIVINKSHIYEFKYIHNSTERLKLQKIELKDNETNKIEMSYNFTYNPLKLPQYNSMQTDNWGYYNGKDFSHFVDKENDYPQLYKYRSSDATKMQAELLQSIIFPTGGKWILEYEPNSYSKKATKYPCTLVNESGITGGARIKSIQMISDVDPPVKKEYKYINSDGSSSGILSHQPLYIFKLKESQDPFREKNLYNLKSITWLTENHISYSRVIENLSNGSQTIYTFTNFNTHNDLDPINRAISSQGGSSVLCEKHLDEKYTTQSLNRGLLTKVELYDNNNKIVKTEQLEYNIRNDQYLLAINRKPYDDYAYYINTNKIFTHYPYLKKKKIVTYFPAGNIEETIENKYNESRLLTESSFKNSLKENVVVKFKYPNDFINNEPYKSMVASNMLSNIIEKYTSVNNSITIENTDYADFNGLYLPQSIKLKKDNNQPELRIKYNNYDEYGNPTFITKDNLLNKIYIWGYNGQYPIVEITNANYNQMKAIIDESTIKAISKKSEPSASDWLLLNKLRENSNLTEAEIKIYTYKPLFGIESISDPSGVMTYYYYDALKRLTTIKDHKGNIIKAVNYNYANQ